MPKDASFSSLKFSAAYKLKLHGGCIINETCVTVNGIGTTTSDPKYKSI
uniref:Uncharacterized protein n=1 Tax=Arundo donax TaxID=35708 RepID=A0A0A9AAD3_ARUDO